MGHSLDKAVLVHNALLWLQWLDFKTSSVMVAREHALFTGDSGLLSQLWSDNDNSILVSSVGGRFRQYHFNDNRGERHGSHPPAFF